MIDWRDPDGRGPRDITARAMLRWGMAAIAVVSIHAGGVWAALRWNPATAAPGDPPAPVMIELAPLAVAPDEPRQDVTPGPQMTQAEPQPTPTEPDTPPEETKSETEPEEPEPQARMAQVEERPPVETPAEIDVPDLPPIPNAAATLVPPPKTTQPRPERLPPRPVKRVKKAEPKRPNAPAQRSAQHTAAPPTAQVQRSNRAAAPNASSSQAPSVSPATWRGSLIAHLNRHKRFPAGAATGTAQVVFTIDRAGRVLSASLVRSSGDRALDAESASLPRRASPVPAPPAGVGGATVTLAVPIRFHR